MRTLTRLASLAALPFVSGCAVLQHMYVAKGASAISYRNRRFTVANESRVGFSLDAFPTWAFAMATASVSRLDNADYFEPKCFTFVDGVNTHTGCYPHVSAWSHALDVQKRWMPTRTLHPMTSVAFGHLGTRNVYAGSGAVVADSSQRSGYVTLTGGGELNLASWLHVTAAAGYRNVFQRNGAMSAVSRSGLTLTSLVVIGKPYR